MGTIASLIVNLTANTGEFMKGMSKAEATAKKTAANIKKQSFTSKTADVFGRAKLEDVAKQFLGIEGAVKAIEIGSMAIRKDWDGIDKALRDLPMIGGLLGQIRDWRAELTGAKAELANLDAQAKKLEEENKQNEKTRLATKATKDSFSNTVEEAQKDAHSSTLQGEAAERYAVLRKQGQEAKKIDEEFEKWKKDTLNNSNNANKKQLVDMQLAVAEAKRAIVERSAAECAAIEKSYRDKEIEAANKAREEELKQRLEFEQEFAESTKELQESIVKKREDALKEGIDSARDMLKEAKAELNTQRNSENQVLGRGMSLDYYTKKDDKKDLDRILQKKLKQKADDAEFEKKIESQFAGKATGNEQKVLSDILAELRKANAKTKNSNLGEVDYGSQMG